MPPTQRDMTYKWRGSVRGDGLEGLKSRVSIGRVGVARSEIRAVKSIGISGLLVVGSPRCDVFLLLLLLVGSTPLGQRGLVASRLRCRRRARNIVSSRFGEETRRVRRRGGAAWCARNIRGGLIRSGLQTFPICKRLTSQSTLIQLYALSATQEPGPNDLPWEGESRFPLCYDPSSG